MFKKKLNLNNPKDFNEKILWLNYNWQSNLVIQCADKVRVRDYCIDKEVPEILNDIYSVSENANDLEWDKLPENFVLKTNNAQGTNLIVQNASKKLNIQETENILNGWLKENYTLKTAEIHYEKIKPLVFAEKFIEPEEGMEIPMDYKFYCFNGKPKFLSVMYGRTAESLKDNYTRVYYNLNFERIYIQKDEYEPKEELEIKKPHNLNQMIKYAKILSTNIPFVRVDFYNGDKYPVFGEMTFTPSAGLARHFKKDILKQLGDEIILPKKIL